MNTTAPRTDAPQRPYRAQRYQHLRPVQTPQGTVMVSDLLGTPGYPEHGHRDGYTEYGCRCEPCGTGYSNYRAERRAENRQHRTKDADGRLVSDLLGTPGYPPHGLRPSAYWYGCECEPCASAHSRNNDRLREQHRRHRTADADGRLISDLLGTPGFPEHGTTITGAEWYGCECEPCMNKSREQRREPRRQSTHRLRAARAECRTEDADGRLVSDLLGTLGHPEHGTPKGYTDYACRCEPCTGANTTSRQGRQHRYTPAAKAVRPVLAEHWPAGDAAQRDINALAGDLAVLWQRVRREAEGGRIAALAGALAEHPEWKGKAEARQRAAEALAATLAAPRSKKDAVATVVDWSAADPADVAEQLAEAQEAAESRRRDVPAPDARIVVFSDEGTTN